MAGKLGLEGVLYFAVGGVGVGSWTELTNCQDLSVSFERASADATTRANDGFEASIAALKTGSITFSMLHIPGDPGLEAIKDAFLANTHDDSLIGIRALDTAAGGGTAEGWVFNAVVTKFSKSEALRDAQKWDVELKVGQSDTPPEYQTSL